MRALLLVDIQNGFCPGGNLPVPGGDEIVDIANRLSKSLIYDFVVASKDWHPRGHGSFASSHPGKKPFDMGELAGKPQVLWPDHCVQGSHDAEFHPRLDTFYVNFVQRKGENEDVDSYSAFRDNNENGNTGLDALLLANGVTELDVCGLATDYCVQFSALDAVALLPGVKVRFIEDASRGITPEGVAAAIEKMREAGVEIVSSADVLYESDRQVGLNKGHVDFLARLRDRRSLRSADRAEDRIRQYCRKHGLAEVLSGPRRWSITQKGLETLKKTLEERKRT